MKICLIGAAHPCHNPRLVREADTLAEAGCEVRVVAPCSMPQLADRDRQLVSKRRWRLQQVDMRPGSLRSAVLRGVRRAGRIVHRCTSLPAAAELSSCPALWALSQAASAEPADWFIAHTQSALPAAVRAAKRWDAKLGCDCEDLLAIHSGEGAQEALAVERMYLSRCDYVSVPSRAAADELGRLHRGIKAIVLYNVFPLRLAQGMLPPERRPKSGKLRLHWFSQTIGPGRGLEDAFEAVRLLDGQAELFLRGALPERYRSAIQDLIHRHEVAEFVHLLPQIHHDELIHSLERYDVGLALEDKTNRNYAVTVSNKVFSYLLAGLAVAASDTDGQREALTQFPEAGFLYSAGDGAKLAAGLQKWVQNRRRLEAAQQAAWDAARSRFCWDVESARFLEALGLTQKTPRATPASLPA